MALSPNFSCSQNAGSPGIFTIQDTSTGSDVLVTQRRVYLLQADGTYLVPSGVTTNYIEWPIANSTISLNVLNQDTALEITVQWLNLSNVVLYDKTQVFGFDAFGQNFFYGLSDGQVPITNPPVALSTSYYQNKIQFYCYLVSAAQAIAYASDLYKAQSCYDLDQAMINNQQYYF
jgi:hypothetical protein